MERNGRKRDEYMKIHQVEILKEKKERKGTAERGDEDEDGSAEEEAEEGAHKGEEENDAADEILREKIGGYWQ